jgi:hypothetical protein
MESPAKENCLVRIGEISADSQEHFDFRNDHGVPVGFAAASGEAGLVSGSSTGQGFRSEAGVGFHTNTTLKTVR